MSSFTRKDLALCAALGIAVLRLKGTGRRIAFAALIALLLRKIAARRCTNKHPGLSEIPVIGNSVTLLLDIQENNTHKMCEIIQQNGFKNFDLHWANGLDFQVLLDERDRMYLLRDNWTKFTKNVDDIGWIDSQTPVFGHGIFAVDGEEWANHRKAASAMFSTSAMRVQMEEVFVRHAKTLTKELQAKAGTGKVVDMQNVFQAFTFDTMCEIAFGMDTGALKISMEGGKHFALDAFDAAQQIVFVRHITPPFMWKTLYALGIGEQGQLDGHVNVLKKFLSKIVTDRQHLIDNTPEPNGNEADKDDGHNDLLSMYIKYAHKNNKPEMLDSEYLVYMIINFLVAGRDTTACALTNIFKYLSDKPEVQTKLVDEYASVIKKGSEPTLDAMKKAAFADSCFNETLRLCPSVPSDGRLANEDVTFPSGTKVKKGTMCIIHMYAMARNPATWGDDAAEWVPERWLEWDNGKNLRRIPEEKMPSFWGGPRACLGKDMARFEAKIVMEALTKTIDIKCKPHDGKIAKAPVMFYAMGLPATIEHRK